MTKTTPPPIPAHPGATTGRPASRLGKILLGVLVAVLVLFIAVALTLFRIYGTDTHHSNREDIWWSERGRGLIPPAATAITLQQDFLDHYAVYTIAEPDLNDFLDKRFAPRGKPLHSFADRSPVDPSFIGTTIGRLGWVVAKDAVVYDYAASNGGMHTYYHDPATGSTYQVSVYW